MTDTTDAWAHLLACYRSGQISELEWTRHLQDPNFSAWVTGQNLERTTPVEDIQSTNKDIRSTMDEQAYWQHLANILDVNLWGWTYKNSGSFHWGENMRYTVSIPGEFAEKIFLAVDRVKNSSGENATVAAEAGRVLTADDVRGRLRQACAAAGGRNKWAAHNDTTRAYVSLVLRGGFPGPLITEALGLKKIITWSLDLEKKPLDLGKEHA